MPSDAPVVGKPCNRVLQSSISQPPLDKNLFRSSPIWVVLPREGSVRLVQLLFSEIQMDVKGIVEVDGHRSVRVDEVVCEKSDDDGGVRSAIVFIICRGSGFGWIAHVSVR